MKILILWSRLSDYMVASFQHLAKKSDVEIFWVFQPTSSNAPFNPFDLSFCSTTYEDKNKDLRQLKEVTKSFKPDIVFMASWNFRHYMKLAKQYKKKGIPVISSFDNQWLGTPKQYLGTLTSFLFLKPTITNFLVPGDRQAQFARKLGYKNSIQGLYCANTNNFKNSNANITSRRFVFVGRFIEQKSIQQLIEAYKAYCNAVSEPWKLRMIGAGPLIEYAKNIDGVEVEKFAQPFELPQHLSECSCFILPSKHENWGLVIHEAALTGLPLICSSACGATTWFLRAGQNGYLTTTSTDSIKNAMIKIHKTSSSKLKEMSECSSVLGKLWTVEKWADHIHSTFNTYINK